MVAIASVLRKTSVAAVAAATLAVTMAPSDAEAGHRRGHGAAVAAGIIGGIAAGALIAGAARPAYGAPVIYDRGPAYPAYYGGYGGGYREVYEVEPVCYWQRKRVWIGHNTYQVRRVRVCE